MPPAAEKTTIAILGGNAVVGRVLEVLLRGLGYEARFLGEPEAFVPEELFEALGVLLLGPGLGDDRRGDYMRAMAGTLNTAAIPVLAFSPGPKGTIAEEDRLVPWPCKMEDLAREIEAVLPPTSRRRGELETAFGS